MTVSEIIAQYLLAHGFDGLYKPNGECACLVSDLGPCDECWALDCRAGYRVNTPDDPEGFDYHIMEEKPGDEGSEG